ncbi:MAG: hypothetical protein J5838_04305 [Desulfovibrio sp.]|nr:hypothetical protein [Desulfovibrio sp.]
MPAMARNLLKLAAISCGLWFFFSVLTPRMVSVCPNWQRYGAVQEENGLDSGALYYSDVPVTLASEEHVRQAVREGMAERQRSSAQR